MRARLVSTALLTIGVLAGVGAVLGPGFGFEPARLPASLLNAAAYKLTFIAAAGLLAAGAVVGRHARRQARAQGAEKAGPGAAMLAPAENTE